MPQLMRDAFIDEVYRLAQQDKDVVFISADFGAKALDDFRANLPDQFIHAGISEQNMVDLGAGLAISGKKVFLYAMAPFITTRCYEQVKAVVSAMSLPITLVAVGVGLGYDHATLTHFTPEDIAIMRALNGIEVLSPCDAITAKRLATLAVEQPAFRYIRLERLPLADLATETSLDDSLQQGFSHLKRGQGICVVTTGYMTHTALKVSAVLAEQGHSVGVIDITRIKAMDTRAFATTVSNYHALVTLDEQLLDGGLGSVVLETLADQNTPMQVSRLGIRDGFEVVNGHRQQLHRRYGIDEQSLKTRILEISQ